MYVIPLQKSFPRQYHSFRQPGSRRAASAPEPRPPGTAAPVWRTQRGVNTTATTGAFMSYFKAFWSWLPVGFGVHFTATDHVQSVARSDRTATIKSSRRHRVRCCLDMKKSYPTLVWRSSHLHFISVLWTHLVPMWVEAVDWWVCRGLFITELISIHFHTHVYR